MRLAGDISLEHELNIPEKLLPYPIIQLLLQPIVENTLEHGFSGFQDYGHISIVVEEIIDNSDAYLIITVRDNGIGMSEDELSKIRRALEIWPPEDDLGFFGLYNIMWRLRTFYGPSAGMKLSSEVGEYMEVKLFFPLIKKGDAGGVHE